ncbi:hypothetical protein JM83_2581 [Gillisia sp. Hel_I_86]|uniref:hypothetical protein n=1 Tax=Gillisia sp. Hel_I_86 TaxID=1249981 RepID=UPI00119A3ED8|nr:hypothetical protein [Gillisia sp. Hel_I_86]TVZ27533.1 hypothetical protein JM83_2581 [Gillisia sp. Hel_I_86]
MKWIFSFILIALTTVAVVAQAPEKMSYQGVIRNSSNQLVNASDVALKILVKQGSANGSVVYEESHYTKTNGNGLVSLQIGTGTRKNGKFGEINWSEGPYFVESRVDPNGGGNYTISGISQMLSVPYALHAKSAEIFTGTISGSQISDLDFKVNNNSAFNGWDKNSDDDFSGDYQDLTNLPDLYTREEIDKLFIDVDVEGGLVQTLEWNDDRLSISGGNSITLTKWDTDVTDDFSGVYDDLQNKPELYNKIEIDNLINGIETTGGVPQNLSLENTTLNISNGNSISFDNWDTNVADDFSGVYDDLQNKPELYNKLEIDNLIAGIETTGGVSQNLNLDQNTLSISGGNSISFDQWDTNVADDFSGVYDDLQNKPELYNKLEIDNLINGIETTGGVPQNLNLDQNTLSISGGNSISFDQWDTNVADDFSGMYDDLQNKPELYSKTEIDNLIAGIETTGGVSQNLNLDQNTLSISGGNSISFDQWDTNVADDFSGVYDDLQNKPELYNKLEIDNLINGIETTGGVPQNLNLDQNTLSISGGNSISFDQWDTNVADDFSGMYDDLQNKPELYSKTEIDNLIAGIETTGGVSQNLNLDQTTLSISGGNSISFDQWDTNANDDFDGAYSSLTGSPKIYTQDEVNNIKAEILKQVEDNYAKKAIVVPFSSSRNINNNDVGNTLACTSTATLTISSGFSAMEVGDVINLEVHGTTFTVKGASGVLINGKSGGNTSIGNNEFYTGGILRKTGNNSYIVL